MKTQEAEADSSFSVSVKDFYKTQFHGGEKCLKKDGSVVQGFFSCAEMEKEFSLAEIDMQYIMLNFIRWRHFSVWKFSKMVQSVDLKYWGVRKGVVVKLDS